MDEIDDRHGNRTLREGLVATMRAGAMQNCRSDALTALLAAAFDRAALAIDAGAGRRVSENADRAYRRADGTGPSGTPRQMPPRSPCIHSDAQKDDLAL